MALRRSEKKAIEFFKARPADRLPDEKIELLLWGSKARGDDMRGSDIDLMVLLKSDTRDVVDEIYEIVIERGYSGDHRSFGEPRALHRGGGERESAARGGGGMQVTNKDFER